MTPDLTPAAPEPAATPTPARRHGLGWAALLAVLAAFFTLVVAGYLHGDRLYRVTTPSMGTWAPVGTALVTRPAEPASLQPGQVIVFRNPGGRTYSHRIVADDHGAITTKGDVNGANDPWTLHASDVHGTVWFRVRYAGYLLQAMPWLLGGALLTEVLVHLVLPLRWRQRARFLLGFATLDAAAIAVHPFTGAVAMAYAPLTAAGMQAIVVATGIFPVRVQGSGGTFADLHQGQVGRPIARHPGASGLYEFTPSVHMSWVWWVGVVLVSLLPLAWCLIHGIDEQVDEHVDEDTEANQGGDADGAPPSNGGGDASTGGASAPDRPRLGVVVAASVVALGTLAASAAAGPAQAGFTAKVVNSTNSAGTRQFFTCLDAMDAYAGTNVLYAGYTLGNGTGVTGTTDQSSVGPYTMTITNGTQTTDVGCASDYRKRSQDAIVLNGTTKMDLGAGSSISEVTTAPGNSDNMTWQEWFKTTTTTGGILACSADSGDGCGDRTTWMDNSGYIVFGVGSSEIKSNAKLNDGTWHMAVTQVGSGGMKMWIDGVLQTATNASVTSGSATIQYPQWGYGSSFTSSLADHPTTLYFTGEMQMVAMYGKSQSGYQVGTADVLAIYQSAF